jgi:flagellar biosynthesis/type III secretory pathway chaperone
VRTLRQSLYTNLNKSGAGSAFAEKWIRIIQIIESCRKIQLRNETLKLEGSEVCKAHNIGRQEQGHDMTGVLNVAGM